MRRTPSSFLPPIALDPRSEAPLYRQLSDWFRRSIADGSLKPGQRMPSTRSLAGELKISRIPVLGAYEQLYAEGYLETFVGAGTCVARSIPDESLRPAGTKAQHPVGRAAPRKTSRRVAAMRAPAHALLPNLGAFRMSLPALDQFPMSTWAKLLNRHSRRQPIDSLAYGDAMGHLPFREAIAEYLGAARAVRCEASRSSSPPALSRACRSRLTCCWIRKIGCGWKSPVITVRTRLWRWPVLKSSPCRWIRKVSTWPRVCAAGGAPVRCTSHPPISSPSA